MIRTIKFMQMLLILGGLLLAGSGAQASGLRAEMEAYPFPQVSPGQGATSGGGGGGGDFPWPWDFAVKFPWENVQGVWRAQKDGRSVYFMFRRVQPKRIKIKQIDVNTCEVVGIGQGYERAKTVIVAQMIGQRGNPYNFTLYAFNEEDSPEPPILSKVGTEQVIVVRINSLVSSEPDFAAQMVRISDRLEMTCGPDGEKIRF